MIREFRTERQAELDDHYPLSMKQLSHSNCHGVSYSHQWLMNSFDDSCYDSFDEEDSDFDDNEGFEVSPFVTGLTPGGFDLIEEEEEEDNYENEERVVGLIRSTTSFKLSSHLISDDKPVRPPVTLSQTFLNPVDLPEYEEQLERLGLHLEQVTVVTDNHDMLVTGTVKIHDRLLEQFMGPQESMTVNVKYSTDGWSSCQCLTSLTWQEPGKLGFELSCNDSLVTAGDAIEFKICCELARDGEKGVIEDNNHGLSYRIICKSKEKSKFGPGKSLW